jgi:hypothetical protein
MSWCQSQAIEYVFGLAQNARLKKQIEAEMAEAEQMYQQTQAPARRFSEFFYSTHDSWSRKRGVIAIAEHLEKGANPRFISS